MNCVERVALTMSLTAVAGVSVMLMNECRKNSKVWCSLKQEARDRELWNFKD